MTADTLYQIVLLSSKDSDWNVNQEDVWFCLRSKYFPPVIFYNF